MDFQYTINPYGQTPVIQINNHIGYDDEDGQGINGVLLAREVFELDSLEPKLLTFYVNCIGGDVKEGFDIFNAIARAKCKTKTVISGFAYSTGGWCTLSADIIEVYDHAIWMCHLPYNPNDPSKISPLTENGARSIAKIIAGKSGRNGKKKLTPEDVLELMRKSTYFTPDELFEKGLIDRILTASGKVKRLENMATAEMVEIKPLYTDYQVLFNKLITETETFNNNVMSKLNNRLNIAADSGEQDQVEAIARLENKISQGKEDLKTANDKIVALGEEKVTLNNKVTTLESEKAETLSNLNIATSRITALEAELKTANEEKGTLQNKVTEFETKEAASAEALLKEKCTNLVKGFVKIGKIANKAEVISGWEAQAFSNFDATKLLLDTMPVNMSVPIPIEETTEDGGAPREQSLFEKRRLANKADRDAKDKARMDELAAAIGK